MFGLVNIWSNLFCIPHAKYGCKAHIHILLYELVRKIIHSKQKKNGQFIDKIFDIFYKNMLLTYIISE